MSTVLTRTWQDVARHLWPDARWVLGEGQFATVRGCGGSTTVFLHSTVEQGRHALRNMHRGGGRCDLRHVLIELNGLLDE